jgi:hypothetical protein
MVFIKIILLVLVSFMSSITYAHPMGGGAVGPRGATQPTKQETVPPSVPPSVQSNEHEVRPVQHEPTAQPQTQQDAAIAPASNALTRKQRIKELNAAAARNVEQRLGEGIDPATGRRTQATGSRAQVRASAREREEELAERERQRSSASQATRTIVPGRPPPPSTGIRN